MHPAYSNHRRVEVEQHSETQLLGACILMQYLRFLDGLRAVAVLSVVFYHLRQNFVPNGYLGVDIFFVISGFIVSYSVAQRTRSGLLTFIIDFYARRFLRIVPALMVCLIATGYASFLFVPEAWLSSSIDTTGLYAFFGISNIFLANGTDYFSPVTEFNPFTHTWSLGVEEQFYVLFPFLFFPWLVGRRYRTASIAAYILMASASLVAWLYLYHAQPLQAFYTIYARFWALGVGVGTFQLTEITKARRSITGKMIDPAANVTASFALIILLGALFYRLPAEFGWVNNALAVFATAVVIGCLQLKNLSGAPHLSLLERRPIRALGWISYSLYLWHWPVFVIARWTVGLETGAQMLAAMALAILLATASYVFIEKPIRQARILHVTPRFAIVCLGLTVIAGSWGAYDWMQTNKQAISQSVVAKDRLDWIPDPAIDSYPDIPGCTIDASATGSGISYKRALCPTPEMGQRVFALGDSHIGAYIPLLKRFTLTTGVESVILSTAGCPFLSLQWNRDNDPACQSALQSSLDVMMNSAKAGDVVFLASLRLPRLAEQFAKSNDAAALAYVEGSGSTQKRELAIEAAIQKLKPLANKGVRIVFEAPKPLFRTPPFRCDDWFNRANPSCADGFEINREFVERLRKPTLDGFQQIVSVVPGVSVWDPFPMLCPDAKCSAFRNGKPLFFDADHISGYGDILLTPFFVERMKSELSLPNQDTQKILHPIAEKRNLL